MPYVPMDFLRGALGVLCVFFAHMSGRAAGAVHQGRQRPARVYGWMIRTVLCAVFVFYRQGLDFIGIAVCSLAAIGFGAGMYMVTRQKPPEDLSHQIFPE